MRHVLWMVALVLWLVSPLRAHGPGDPIDVVFTEVSIYSLPHIVVKHEFAIAPEGVIVADGPNPSLRVSFKMVDHSHGTNVDSHCDFLVYEDEGFPLKGRPDWVLVHEANRVTSNVSPDIRNATQKLFDAHGDKLFELPLDAARPIKKIKVVAHAKLYNPIESVNIRKPLMTQEAEDSRVFYVALRPRWGTVWHDGGALVRQFRQLLALRDELVRWQGFASRIGVANRSVADASNFPPEDLTAVLRATAHARENLDEVTDELLATASRCAGRPPEKIDAMGKDLLGVRRLAFNYKDIHASLAERTPGMVPEAGNLRNLLIASGNLFEAGGVRRQLDRAIGQCDMALKSLTYLWGPNDSGELRSMLAGFDRSAKGAATDLDRLGGMLDRELGRESDGGWSSIESSGLYSRRFPSGVADSGRGAMLLRGLYSDLLYLTLETEYNMRVAAAWAKLAGQRLGEIADRAAQMAPDPDLSFPVGLFIEPAGTTQTIEPGQVARFAVRVENQTTMEREVRIVEAESPPDGWHTRVEPETARLAPGDGVTVHYALGAPSYAHQPINHVSTLKIGWQDEPGQVHQPQFLTRLKVAGMVAQLPGPKEREAGYIAPENGAAIIRASSEEEDNRDGRSFLKRWGKPTKDKKDGDPAETKKKEIEGKGDGLLVSTDSPEHLFLEPGAVGRYQVKVIHKGGGPRRVSIKLMTPVPERWIVAIDPEEADMAPESIKRFNMRITAPIDTVAARRIEVLLGIGYTDEFSRVDKVAFRKVLVELNVVRSKPLVNNGEVRTYRTRTGVSTTMLLELANIGSVDDTFDLFVDQKPKDWYVHLDKTHLRVAHKKEPMLVPITVRPPLGALQGEFERIVVRAVSIGHPEISTKQALTVAVVAPGNFALEPKHERYLVAPGTEGRIEFRARNVMDRPVKLAWKVSPRTVHPEWLTFDEPITELAAEQEATLSARVKIPHGVPLDRDFPVAIMALDEHGGEIVSAVTTVHTIPVHRVQIRAVQEKIVRTRTLLMIPLEVTNHGAAADDVALILEGKRRYWAKLSHRKLFLRPGQRFTAMLTVRVPVEAEHDQDADLLVQATSLTDGGARDFVRVGVAAPYVIRTNASTYGTRPKF